MSRQSCRRNVNRIRLHRSYTMAELASVLGVHVRTVQTWRKEGMLPIDEYDRPMLFIGEVVRTFLKRRQQARKCKLQARECYCLRCNTSVLPVPESITVEVTDRRVGKTARAVVVRGKCSTCGARVVRFTSTNSILNTPWWTNLREADKRLIGTSVPSLNTDLKQE